MQSETDLFTLFNMAFLWIFVVHWGAGTFN